jgi:hypothetical protein
MQIGSWFIFSWFLGSKEEDPFGFAIKSIALEMVTGNHQLNWKNVVVEYALDNCFLVQFVFPGKAMRKVFWTNWPFHCKIDHIGARTMLVWYHEFSGLG